MLIVATWSLCSQFRSKVLEAQQTHERDQKLHTHKKFADDDKSKSFKAGSLPAREMLYSTWQSQSLVSFNFFRDF
jgi:hypothetical protein